MLLYKTNRRDFNLKKLLLCSVLVGLIAQPSQLFANELKDKFNSQKEKLSNQFNQSTNDQVAMFQQARAAYLDQFSQTQEIYRQLWDTPALSDKDNWITYSKDKKIRRIVNFETGEYSIEAVGEYSPKELDEIVNQQTEALSNETVSSAINNDPVLGALTQSQSQQQKVFTNLDSRFLEQSQKRSVSTSSQGNKVTKVIMKLPQESLTQRAQQYIPTIKQQGKRWEVDPALIIAIMHTESHFNPVAQSHIPAYGLMQIVPSSAGKDVTKNFEGKVRLLSPKELFEPEFNIIVGSAYLNILQAKYLKSVKNPTTRMYLAISAYNGGIGAVAKHFSGSTSLTKLASSVETMSPTQVYNSLVNQFPYKETRDYLKKVESQRQYYAPYF